MIIKSVKTLGFIMTGLATIAVIGGIALVWLSGMSAGTPVSVDERALYSGTSEDNVALMFNVYSGEEHLPSILQTLEDHGAKATFFIGGVWAEKHADALSDIVDAGQETGSHGYLHRDHSAMDYEANLEEMRVAHKLITGMTGQEITLFAPPSGAYNTATLDAAETMGYRTVLWSKDTIDWRDHDSALIAQRATDGLTGGDLILMHPTAETALALDEVLDAIENAGLNAATVSETL